MSLTLEDPTEIHAGPHRDKRREANWLTQVESPTGNSTLGRVTNVSLGGLLVKSATTFHPGTHVTIRFHLRLAPDSHFIESRGLVVHEETGARMGIQFLQLQDSARRALSDYLLASAPATRH